MTYHVKLQVFEGPLDLLLYLIKKNEVDIYNIPIATITQQYLDYVNMMQLLDLNMAAEFLVMAATLMQIKSRLLLPQEERPPEEAEEPDPREELVRRLLEYQRFKEVARHLSALEWQRRHVFVRVPSADGVPEAAPAEEAPHFEASLFDLLSAFSTVLTAVSKEQLYEIARDEVTVEQKVHELLHLLLKRTSLRFEDIFASSHTRLEIIATFLALLELVRLREVAARQETLFGPITIVRRDDRIAATRETHGTP